MSQMQMSCSERNLLASERSPEPQLPACCHLRGLPPGGSVISAWVYQAPPHGELTDRLLSKAVLKPHRYTSPGPGDCQLFNTVLCKEMAQSPHGSTAGGCLKKRRRSPQNHQGEMRVSPQSIQCSINGEFILVSSGASGTSS